ncbi:MAG: ice-binding family protein [Vicinamibacterales bacterium]|nr:ice-binding family protein [Vicinamibacterales bacterium]
MTRHLKSLAAVVGASLLLWAAPAAAQSSTSLGAADSFVVLAGSTVTNTGSSVLTGDMGVSPGATSTGFPPGTVSGTTHLGNATSLAAQNAVTTAYNDLAGRPVTQNLTGLDLGGRTLTPGVYKFDTSAQLTGTLTLDGQGLDDPVFIFQMGSTLTTASGSVVALINGGSLCNVFWQVGSSATLGTNSTFKGNILALTSITVTTGAQIVGRLLARNGAVTLDTNNVARVLCATAAPPATCPVIGLTPTTLPAGGIGVAYSVQFQGNSGTAPYVYTLRAALGALPAGLTLASTGLLSGTPTQAVPQSFTIRATDARGCFIDQRYTLTIGTEVPTLPQVFMIVLTLGLLLAGYVQLRRRRISQ